VKVVLDTNVLIAAFIAHGLCADLLEHGVQTHELVTSDFIINEFVEKLTGKFKFSVEEAEAAAGLLLAKMTIVKPVEFPSPVCRDRDDDKVLGTALAGNCACIITGDKDLLVLKRFNGIDIVSPSDFLEYEASR